MALTLQRANKLIEKAANKAVELAINIGVAVVDGGGHLIAAGRMDGTGFLALEMAMGKAFTAIAFGADTAQMAQVVGQMPFFANGPEMSGGRLVLMGGGVPIREADQIVGAIGIAGAPEEQDIECAQAALA